MRNASGIVVNDTGVIKLDSRLNHKRDHPRPNVTQPHLIEDAPMHGECCGRGITGRDG